MSPGSVGSSCGRYPSAGWPSEMMTTRIFSRAITRWTTASWCSRQTRGPNLARPGGNSRGPGGRRRRRGFWNGLDRGGQGQSRGRHRDRGNPRFSRPLPLPVAGGQRYHFIRITPDTITGRRFQATPPLTWWTQLSGAVLLRLGMAARSHTSGSHGAFMPAGVISAHPLGVRGPGVGLRETTDRLPSPNPDIPVRTRTVTRPYKCAGSGPGWQEKRPEASRTKSWRRMRAWTQVRASAG
ncbi:hypothetical protein SRABI83_00257 [Arthrobacter sp. Bi83]|nr:hypothetical protein SRABI83_00257 [Arthrobacter sp. Bi83]